MQSSTLTRKPANIMEDLDYRFSAMTKGLKANFQKLAYQRDPDSLLDEALIAVWVLLVLAMLFTIGFGAYYHFQIFQSAFGTAALSIAGSFGVFVVLEICKVFFGLHLLRTFFSMLWWKSLYRLGWMLGIAIIVFVSFKWSINISTKGIAEVNNSLKIGAIYEAEPFTTPPSIADIDVQIAELSKAKEAGAKSTWKGRTTRNGIKVIQSNTELQAQLVKQRETLLAAAMAQHDSLQTVKLQEVKTTSTMLTDYGGKAEYATALLLFLVVCLEFINYDKNKGDTPVRSLKK